MSTDQLSKINTKAYHVENAKRRVTEAEKSLTAAISEKESAERDLNLRAKEYRDACDQVVGISQDFSRGYSSYVIR